MIVDGKWFPGAIANLPCPDCATFMELRASPYKGSGVYYRCPDPDCGRGTHGAHPDGGPLGVPASEPTKQARIRAHEAFDTFWKGMAMRRGDAYRWLAKMLDLPVEHCHIGQFTILQCEQVVAAVSRFRPAGPEPRAKKTPHLSGAVPRRQRRRR
jgi:hypothetical protein